MIERPDANDMVPDWITFVAGALLLLWLITGGQCAIGFRVDSRPSTPPVAEGVPHG